MQIFGVFVLWKRASAESNGYPSLQDIMLVNEQSPQPLQDWKAALMALAAPVNKSDAFLFYNRLDLANGDVLSMTYYTSQELFDAFQAAHDALAADVTTARAALGVFLELEVIEKRATFEMDQLDYDSPESALAFFNSLP